MDDKTIKALIKKTRRGDAGAYAQLIKQYGRSTMGYLINMVSDRTKAEDIYQNVWLKLPSKLNLYDMSLRFEPWLMTLVRNTALDYLRRESTHSRVLDIDDVKHLSVRGQAVDDAVTNRVCLDEALMALSEELRQIILLRYMSDMSYREIAESLQMDTSDVKWKLYDAKKKLRVFLTDRGIDKWIAN